MDETQASLKELRDGTEVLLGKVQALEWMLTIVYGLLVPKEVDSVVSELAEERSRPDGIPDRAWDEVQETLSGILSERSDMPGDLASSGYSFAHGVLLSLLSYFMTLSPEALESLSENIDGVTESFEKTAPSSGNADSVKEALLLAQELIGEIHKAAADKQEKGDNKGEGDASRKMSTVVIKVFRNLLAAKAIRDVFEL